MQKTTNRIRNVIELVIAGTALLLTWALCWSLWIAEAMKVDSKVCLILMLAYLVVNIVLAFAFQEKLCSKLMQIICAEALQIVPALAIAIVASFF